MFRLSQLLAFASSFMLLTMTLVACGSAGEGNGSNNYSERSRDVALPAATAALAPLAPAAGDRSTSSSESAPPLAPRTRSEPSTPRPRERYQPRESELKAGEVDDNERWEDYLEFRRDYRGPRVREVDVTERYIISVLDRENRPVPNASVFVSTDRNTVFEGRTYANGKTLFFPKAFSRTGDAELFRLYVEKDGESQYLDAERYGSDQWVIKLDIDSRNRSGRTPLDVLLLVDSTGSMADEIDRIKETLLSISERINDLPSRPDLSFGMVTYRDRGDEYITRMYDFSSNVRRFLRTIEGVEAGGGGDYPESLNEALNVAVDDPYWRIDEAVRLVFLVADAPPHLDYSQDYDYSEEMMEANRLGIKIFPIASSGLDEQGEYIFRQIAQHTMGRFLFLLYSESGTATTPHAVEQYTVQQLDDLVVRIVEEELSHLNPRGN